MGEERLAGGYILETCSGWAELTTDALALADFSRPERGDRVCDLGCGGGALLLLLARETSLTLHGVERLPQAAALCRRNLAQGDLPGRSRVFCGDVRAFSGGPYDLVLCNPPYFPLKSGKLSQDPLRRAARFEICGGIVDFCACAGRILRPQGRFCCVFPRSREQALGEALAAAGLTPARREALGRKLLLTEAIRKGEA